MKQLVLDLGAEPVCTLESFEVGRNAEVAALMRQFAERSSREHFAYLWGETGAGKSHLLKALASSERARYISPFSIETEFLYSPEVDLYLLDDCEKLSPVAQIDAFALFNEIRANNAFMVSAGSVAPAVLPVREDLRTRMGWGLVYQIHGLTDEEKLATLTQMAEARGLILSPGVLPYLLSHFQRDMVSLSSMLDSLDQYSLETKRPITLPLLREWLQEEAKE
ncbi:MULTISPECIES: DnaA regulatory inactivator Hda [unclassified Duganella]|uniref:DnaA regulatory inactivator Hda n=1 Tax=unclassified Duganella TaxID=2636909 RepID=UPI0006FC0413|nr:MULTISPECIES: DnaA regulatory inactivator Hda [unclassified Duganella]KQV47612.1 DnaA regulatory inactivator Hda [Duganella sp. Root336D2]KRB82101.1 DnaA regulatory inactivator Hda [Duganella sp. Root198D2]